MFLNSYTYGLSKLSLGVVSIFFLLSTLGHTLYVYILLFRFHPTYDTKGNTLIGQSLQLVIQPTDALKDGDFGTIKTCYAVVY